MCDLCFFPECLHLQVLAYYAQKILNYLLNHCAASGCKEAVNYHKMYHC